MVLSEFIKIFGKEAIKVGMWYTMCCEMDLEEIKSKEQIEEILDNIGDGCGIGYEIWNNELEALLSLQPKWDGEYDKETKRWWDDEIARVTKSSITNKA